MSSAYLKAFVLAAVLSWLVIVVLALCLAKASKRAESAETKLRIVR